MTNMSQPVVGFAIASSITLTISTAAIGIGFIGARKQGAGWSARGFLVLLAYICQIGYCIDEAVLGTADQLILDNLES